MSDPESSFTVRLGELENKASLSPTDNEIATVFHYINEKIMQYKTYEMTDEDLWESLQLDFKGVTEAELAAVPTACIRHLRELLRRNGVYVSRDQQIPADKSLYKVIHEEKPQEWPRDEILKYLKRNGNFNSPAINEYLRENNIPFATFESQSVIVRHGLPNALRKDDKVLHIKLIQACQDTPACTHAGCMPSDTIYGQIEDLQASIPNYEKRNQRLNDTLFTNRHRNPRQYPITTEDPIPEQISDSGLDEEYQEEIPVTDNFADFGGSTMQEASLKSECRVCYDNECAILLSVTGVRH